MCKYRADQYLIVLNLYSISINIILVTDFITAKVSQNLNSMKKMSTQWNHEICRYMFSKVIEVLEKSNFSMNAKHLKSNRFQKTIRYKRNE